MCAFHVIVVEIHTPLELEVIMEPPTQLGNLFFKKMFTPVWKCIKISHIGVYGFNWNNIIKDLNMYSYRSFKVHFASMKNVLPLKLYNESRELCVI